VLNIKILSLEFWRSFAGGPEGIRTPDLLGAIQARSQLRHRPCSAANIAHFLQKLKTKIHQSKESFQLSPSNESFQLSPK
jgi:hypothetical protein